MALTWQSVAAPQFGAANQQMNRGLDRINQGLQGFRNVVNQEIATDKAEDEASFQHKLLDIGATPEVDEKAFLSEALKLGKESGLTPKESLAQINIAKDVLEEKASLSTEQQNEYEGLQSQVDAVREQATAFNAGKMLEFDQKNPTSFATSLQQQYGEGTSIGQALAPLWNEVSTSQWFDGIGDQSGEDLKDSMTEIIDSDEFSGINGMVVAEAIKRTGVNKAEWFGADGVNVDTFKKNLRTIYNQYIRENSNLVNRRAHQTSLESAANKEIMRYQQHATDYYRNTRKQNRSK